MAGYDLRLQVPGWTEFRKLTLSAESFPDLLEPVLLKCRLQFSNNRAFEARVHIRQCSGASASPSHLSENPTPPVKPSAIYDEHTSMRSAIRAVDSPRSHRMIVGKGTSSLLKRFYVAIMTRYLNPCRPGLPARAHPHAHVPPAHRETVKQLPQNERGRLRSLPVLRAANCLEHSGKNHLAIVQKLNLVVVDRQGIG